MKKRIIYSVLLILTVLTSSCESWLDVDPRTKVKSDDLFETEAGFKDAFNRFQCSAPFLLFLCFLV